MPRGIYVRKQSAASTSRRHATVKAHNGHASDNGAGASAETPATTQAAQTGADEPEATISVRTRKLIDAVKRSFKTYAHDMTEVFKTKQDLAPDFMKAYTSFEKDTGGSLIDFVREIDPNVPADRAGYRAHSSYRAAENLRRIVQQATQAAKPKVPKEQRPVPPMLALAKLVATVLPKLDPTGAIYAAFVKEMRWTEQQAARLQTLAAKEGAVRLKGKSATRMHLVEKAVETAAA